MKNRASWLLATLPLGFLAVLLVAPSLRLLIEGGALPLWEPWQDSYLRHRLLWSALQALVTCGLTLVLGLPIAWVLARFEFVGRRWVLRLLMLPFVVPTLVAAMGVLALFGTAWHNTPWLLLYGNLFFNLCLVVRAATEALGQVSASRIAAARTLGATPWRVFWRIEWPLILPWLMSALCLVFLYCFSGFGLALVLGGPDYATVEVEIYTLVAHELQLAQAASLALWTLFLCGGVALLYAALERRLSNPVRMDTLARRVPRGAAQWLFVLAALLVLLLVCIAPLLAIVWQVVQAVFGDSGAWAVLQDQSVGAALWNTLRFSVAAVALATLLGVLHALAARRSVGLRALVFLPFVVSPVLVAFGLLLLYPAWTDSLALLVGAYALLAYPFIAKSLASALDAMPAHWEQAARSLGASPWRVFWRVTLPVLRPALRRGIAFAAATAVGEFAVTLFLARPEWATLTTLMYEILGRPGTANRDAALVLACVLMALALLAFAAIEGKSDDDC